MGSCPATPTDRNLDRRPRHPGVTPRTRCWKTSHPPTSGSTFGSERRAGANGFPRAKRSPLRSAAASSWRSSVTEGDLRGIEENVVLGNSLARLLLLDADAPVTRDGVIDLALERIDTGRALVAAGTDGSFVELNRGTPLPRRAEALCYSINPQVHAFDDMSLVESLSAQADTVETARSSARADRS